MRGRPANQMTRRPQVELAWGRVMEWWRNFGKWAATPGYYIATAKSGERISCGYKPGDSDKAEMRARLIINTLDAEWDRMTDNEKIIHQNRILLKGDGMRFG